MILVTVGAYYCWLANEGYRFKLGSNMHTGLPQILSSNLKVHFPGGKICWTSLSISNVSTRAVSDRRVHQIFNINESEVQKFVRLRQSNKSNEENKIT